MEAGSPPRLEAMSIGALLDRAFKLYSANFALLFGIAAIVNIPIYAVQLPFTMLLNPATEPSLEQILTVAAPTLLVLVLWAVLAVPLSTAATAYAVSQRYLGGGVTLASAFGRAWKRFGRLIVAQILVSLWVFLGLFLCFIPGILWALAYSLVIPAIVVEDVAPGPSLKRSKELTAGFRDKVFVVLFILGALNMVVVMGVGVFAGLIATPNSVTGNVVATALNAFASTAIAPLGSIASILLYYDFRIRKEAFDLEVLSRAFDGGAAPAPGA